MRKISFLLLIFFIVCGLSYPHTLGAESGAGILMTSAEEGFSLANKKMPRVMVLIAERNAGQDYSGYLRGAISEDVIRSRFSKRGFTFVDYSIPEGTFDFETFYKSGDLSDGAAVSFGEQGGAEIIIFGKAIVKCVGNVAGTTVRSFQSALTAKAVRIDNGVVVAAGQAEETTVHMDELTGGSEAIEKAAVKLADLLESQISARWRREVDSSTVVAMTIRGMRSCSDFVLFTEALKTKVRGITDVRPRRIESGLVKLDVDMQGGSQSLADSLSVQKFSGFSLDITDISKEEIELRLYR